MSMRTSSHFLVLGAGPAGLAAAVALADAGMRTTVLDAASYVGGLSRTLQRETEDGVFRFDIGGHRWVTDIEELGALFSDIVGDDALTVERRSSIWINGQRVDYPLRLPQALKPLGPIASARAMKDLVAFARHGRPAPPETMEHVFLEMYGKTLYETYMRPYSRKVWGREPAALSGDWVRHRMTPLIELPGTNRRRRRTVAGAPETFIYPRLGFGMLAERMADRIRQSGQRVLLRHAVERVIVDDDRVRALQVRTEHGVEKMDVDAVVSSLPMPIMARILYPEPPEDVLEATRKLPFRDLITVNLMIRGGPLMPESWLYVHSAEVRFSRVHEPRNWSPSMVPGDGFTSLVVEYPCERGDDVWNLSDEELVTQTIQSLISPLHLLHAEDVIGGFTLRATKAYPVFETGYESKIDRIRDYLERFSNLEVAGRGGTFRYLDSDRSMDSGWQAAHRLLASASDA
jgi:protoporphyrinogen oxidase